MYHTATPSSAVSSCNVAVVGSESLQQRRKDRVDAHEKLDDSRSQSADNGSVVLNSAAESDTTVYVKSSAEVPTTAKPDFQTESCSAAELGNGWALEADNITTCTQVGLLGYEAPKEAADGEVLNLFSSAAGTLFPAPIETGGEVSHDGSEDLVESLRNGDDAHSPWQNDFTQQNSVLPELTSEEKIGFEPDAIIAADQWPPRLPAVERRVKHLQSEVRWLLFDRDGSGRKRELRASGRVHGNVQRKTRRSPVLRLRTMVSLRSAGQPLNRFSNKLDNKRN